MLTSHCNHLIQGPCHQRGCSQKDPSSHWKILRTADFGQDTETEVVWPHLKVLWLSKCHFTEHCEGKKKKNVDRRRGGKTTLRNGQGWILPAQLGQLKAGQGGKGLLQIHLWCPVNLPRLWDRIDKIEARF